MMRAILWTLHALGWAAFVPFAVLSVLALSGALFSGIGEFFVASWVMLGLSMVGLAAVLATGRALKRLKEQELSAPGFEPVMGRENLPASPRSQ